VPDPTGLVELQLCNVQTFTINDVINNVDEKVINVIDATDEMNQNYQDI